MEEQYILADTVLNDDIRQWLNLRTRLLLICRNTGGRRTAQLYAETL